MNSKKIVLITNLAGTLTLRGRRAPNVDGSTYRCGLGIDGLSLCLHSYVTHRWMVLMTKINKRGKQKPKIKKKRVCTKNI